MEQVTDDDLAAAVSILGEGPGALRSFGITLRKAAELAGISRSTAYRRWETIEALSDDWALFTVETEAWPQRLLRSDPAADVSASVLDAMARGPWELGPFARAAVSARPAHLPARAAILDWERRHLDALGAWLSQAIEVRGRVWRGPSSARLSALVLHATIEGSYLLAWADGNPEGVMATKAGRTTSRAAGWLIEAMSDPKQGDGPAARAPAPVDVPVVASGLTVAKRQILGHLTERLGGGDRLIFESFEPARAVDVARLARERGVTERTLFNRWPTAEDFNAAVVGYLIDQRLARVQQFMHDAIDDVVAGRVDTIRDVLVAGFQATVVEGAGPAPYDLWAVSPTFFSPKVQRAAQQALEGQRQQLRAMSLAVFAIGPRHPRPDVDADEIVELLLSFVLGAWRLLALDPVLRDESVTLETASAPLFGAAGAALASTYSMLDDGAGPAAGSVGVGRWNTN